MGLYVLICIDKPNSLELRQTHRPAHLAHVGAHAAMVRLGGPFLSPDGEMNGSMLILEAEDEAAIWAFSDGDPYRQAGLFESVQVRGWRYTGGALP